MWRGAPQKNQQYLKWCYRAGLHRQRWVGAWFGRKSSLVFLFIFLNQSFRTVSEHFGVNELNCIVLFWLLPNGHQLADTAKTRLSVLSDSWTCFCSTRLPVVFTSVFCVRFFFFPPSASLHTAISPAPSLWWLFSYRVLSVCAITRWHNSASSSSSRCLRWLRFQLNHSLEERERKKNPLPENIIPGAFSVMKQINLHPQMQV